MAQRVKPRITITVDPDMVAEIDTYVQEHKGTDRSQVVGEALRSWYANALHEALVRQHAAPKSPEELAERAAWKRIRASLR
jgi:metal-responsive CopG/Arc/MetJ family transcriptional regulator